MPHPDEGLIHAWLDGELDAADAARVEALVADDPAWAAAAAEARGLIAASARIVGTLDHVPANVIPKTPAAPRRSGHPWLWRAAAAVVLMAGSAVVLERNGTSDLPAPKPAAKAVEITVEKTAPRAAPASPEPTNARVANAPVANAPVANAPVTTASAADNKITSSRKELDAPKTPETLRDKDAVSGGALSERRADAAAAAAPMPAGGSAARALAPPSAGAAQGALSLQKTTRMPPSCWEQLQPPDSARRIIRLEAGALEDSIRLERLTVRGDTLAAVHGRLTAVRSRCSAP